ncbi:unnamed protein product [Amoebophrya sp. A25]|nr:unnamed protein product [Amoebophrya sp. A25]|eukprot:GSA25T00025968001.1
MKHVRGRVLARGPFLALLLCSRGTVGLTQPEDHRSHTSVRDSGTNKRNSEQDITFLEEEANSAPMPNRASRAPNPPVREVDEADRLVDSLPQNSLRSSSARKFERPLSVPRLDFTKLHPPQKDDVDLEAFDPPAGGSGGEGVAVANPGSQTPKQPGTAKKDKAKGASPRAATLKGTTSGTSTTTAAGSTASCCGGDAEASFLENSCAETGTCKTQQDVAVVQNAFSFFNDDEDGAKQGSTTSPTLFSKPVVPTRATDSTSRVATSRTSKVQDHDEVQGSASGGHLVGRRADDTHQGGRYSTTAAHLLSAQALVTYLQSAAFAVQSLFRSVVGDGVLGGHSFEAPETTLLLIAVAPALALVAIAWVVATWDKRRRAARVEKALDDSATRQDALAQKLNAIDRKRLEKDKRGIGTDHKEAKSTDHRVAESEDETDDGKCGTTMKMKDAKPILTSKK